MLDSGPMEITSRPLNSSVIKAFDGLGKRRVNSGTVTSGQFRRKGEKVSSSLHSCFHSRDKCANTGRLFASGQCIRVKERHKGWRTYFRWEAAWAYLFQRNSFVGSKGYGEGSGRDKGRYTPG